MYSVNTLLTVTSRDSISCHVTITRVKLPFYFQSQLLILIFCRQMCCMTVLNIFRFVHLRIKTLKRSFLLNFILNIGRNIAKLLKYVVKFQLSILKVMFFSYIYLVYFVGTFLHHDHQLVH